MAAGIDSAGAVYSLTTGGVGAKTFALPANVEEGRKLIVLMFMNQNARITSTPRINGGTFFTLVETGTETFSEPYMYSYTIEAADVGQTEVEFVDNTGTSEWTIMAAWIGDVDLTSAAGAGVQSGTSYQHSSNINFGQEGDVNTLDTDEKLFLVMYLQSRTDVTIVDAGADYDENHWDDVQGDGTIGAPLIVSGSYGWSFLVSSDQWFYGDTDAGSPSPLHGHTGVSGDTIAIYAWFDTQDDANWPYAAGGGGLPATELGRHGDSLLKYLKDNEGVTASEVVSALNEYNGITSPPRKEYKEARDTAFGINGH